MRYVALAILLTISSISCGIPFRNTTHPNAANIREQLWNVRPGGVSVWEEQEVQLPLRVYADPFTQDQVELVVAFWNAQLGAEVLRVIDPNTEADFDIVVGFSNENPNGYNGVTLLVPAEGHRYAIVPVVVMFVPNNDTLVHELGHALGLEHDPSDTGSVMFPYSSGRVLPRVQQIDVVALRWVFGI